MNRKIKVSDGEACRKVSDCAARQKDGHSVGAGSVANLCQRILLSGGQAALQKINVIGHALIIWEKYQRRGCRKILLNTDSAMIYGQIAAFYKAPM